MQVAGDFEGEPGLAGAARTDDVDQPVGWPADRPAPARSAARPTNDVGDAGQVVRAGRERARAREPAVRGRARRAGTAARGRRSRAAGAGRGRASTRRRRVRPAARMVASEHSTWPPWAAAAIRAARCTSGLAYSPADGLGVAGVQAHPYRRPRLRVSASRVRPARAAPRRRRATASAASANATKIESPSVNSGTPPCSDERVARNNRRCSSSTGRYPAPSIRARRVEPSMSVNRNVTNPLGRLRRNTETSAPLEVTLMLPQRQLTATSEETGSSGRLNDDLRAATWSRDAIFGRGCAGSVPAWMGDSRRSVRPRPPAD